MPEDLKKLESLSYRPYPLPANIAVTNTSPVTMGFNSAVIKPEMRVNKTEDVHEQPAKANIEIIEQIEGLLSKALELTYKLPKNPVRSIVSEEIDVLLQVSVRGELRKEFE